MLNRILFLAFYLLLATSAAAQEAIEFAAGSSKWSAVGTVTGAGTTGGTPSADDNFTFASGADVEVTGNVTLSTGSITVGPGARLRVGPGVTLIGGASITNSGGEFVTEGAVLWDGRIQGVSWGNFATGATITLPQDVSGFVAAGDWVVYGDDNPEDGVIQGPVQTTAGSPQQDTFRPSYNRLAWYRVSSVSGNSVTYDYDRFAAEGGTGTPYAGTRGPIAPSNIAVSAIARLRFGQGSTLSVPTGTITATGDGGAQYVEVTSGACNGKMAKVMFATDGGGGADSIHVAGDLSACGTPNIIIHYGARAGDPVKIVRPAVISGLVSGANTTTVRWTAGKVKARWAFFNRLGPTGVSTPSPGLASHCLFCIYAAAADSQPSPGSYITNSMFGHGELNGTSDTATFGIFGNTLAQAARYSGKTLDLTGIDFSNLYIADARETSTNAGVHGFIVSGVKNFNPRHMRIQHMSDDAIALLNANYTNDPEAVSYNVQDLLSYENWTNTASSQQCFEDSVGSIGSGTSHQVYLTRGRGAASDVVTIGCNENQLNIVAHANTYKRFVIGGGGISTTTGNPIIGYGGGYTNLPDLLADQNPNTLSDFVFLGWTTYTSNARFQATGSLRNSVIVYPTSGSNLYLIADARESFFDLNDTPAGAPYMILDFGNAQSQRTTLRYEDSVFVQSGADNFCTNFGNVAAVLTATIRRVFFAGDNAASTGFLYSCFGDPTKIAASGASVDGAYFTAETAGSYGLGAATASFESGARMKNVCQETSQARNVAGTCGTSPTDSCLTFNDLFPKATQGGTLGAFVARGIPGDVCDSAKPRAVGIKTLGVSHAALGDFVLDQLSNFSSYDLTARRVPGWLPVIQ